jgi:hypothetical protein
MDVLKHKLVNLGKIPPAILTELKDLEKEKAEFEKGKLSKSELNKAVQDARGLIRKLIEYVQRVRSRQMEQIKLRVKYGEKIGEVLFLSTHTFFIFDLEKEHKQLKKAIIDEEGNISNLKESSIEELENELVKPLKPRKLFISNSLLKNLESVFGGPVEILVV